MRAEGRLIHLFISDATQYSVCTRNTGGVCDSGARWKWEMSLLNEITLLKVT